MSKTLRRSFVLVLAMLALSLACFGLTACQNNNEKSASEASFLEIGSKDSSAYSIKMTNSCGKSVVSMYVQLPGEENFQANMMTSDMRLKNGETAVIYVPKKSGVTGDYVVDIKVVFNDGGTSVLHHLDMNEFTECTLLLNGKIGYVTYQGKTAKRMVSTLELQTYYYNLEDPDAAARDKAEEEEEKRRLEKLEEDLKSSNIQEEVVTAADGTTTITTTTTNADGTVSTTVVTEDTQGADVEDDPIETNYDGPESD